MSNVEDKNTLLDLDLDPEVSREKLDSMVGIFLEDIVQATDISLRNHYGIKLLELVEASFSHGFNTAVKVMDVKLIDDSDDTIKVKEPKDGD